MTEDKPRHQWFELNDTTVIEAMFGSNDSEYWGQCSQFIQLYLEKRFTNLPQQLQEEVVQESMILVRRNLSTFRYESKFTTWLASIARYRAIDMLRRIQQEGTLDDLVEGHSDNAEYSRLTAIIPRTPEEIALTKEQTQEVLAALEVFLQSHKNYERNKQILQLVLIEGRTYEHTARRLGVSAPIVGYVANLARKRLRQMFPHLVRPKK